MIGSLRTPHRIVPPPRLQSRSASPARQARWATIRDTGLTDAIASCPPRRFQQYHSSGAHQFTAATDASLGSRGAETRRCAFADHGSFQLDKGPITSSPLACGGGRRPSVHHTTTTTSARRGSGRRHNGSDSSAYSSCAWQADKKLLANLVLQKHRTGVLNPRADMRIYDNRYLSIKRKNLQIMLVDDADHLLSIDAGPESWPSRSSICRCGSLSVIGG